MDRPPTSMQFTFMLGFNPARNRHKRQSGKIPNSIFETCVFPETAMVLTHRVWGERVWRRLRLFGLKVRNGEAGGLGVDGKRVQS